MQDGRVVTVRIAEPKQQSGRVQMLEKNIKKNKKKFNFFAVLVRFSGLRVLSFFWGGFQGFFLFFLLTDGDEQGFIHLSEI